MGCRIGKRSFLAKAVCAFGRCVNLSPSFSRARLMKASLRRFRHWLAGPGCRLASRHRKRSKRFWRERGGDCAFWSGPLYRFVQPSQTARYSGPAGQSPLPEKMPLATMSGSGLTIPEEDDPVTATTTCDQNGTVSHKVAEFVQQSST